MQHPEILTNVDVSWRASLNWKRCSPLSEYKQMLKFAPGLLDSKPSSPPALWALEIDSRNARLQALQMLGLDAPGDNGARRVTGVRQRPRRDHRPLVKHYKGKDGATPVYTVKSESSPSRGRPRSRLPRNWANGARSGTWPPTARRRSPRLRPSLWTRPPWHRSARLSNCSCRGGNQNEWGPGPSSSECAPAFLGQRVILCGGPAAPGCCRARRGAAGITFIFRTPKHRAGLEEE